MTTRGVHYASARALANIVLPEATDAKRTMLVRLDDYRQRLNARADQGGRDFAQVMSALIRCEIHEAHLLGLILPTQMIIDMRGPP